ncbi:DNA repair protein RecN [Treponema saccharophilum]|uniref:DNA repair protein RecN n=1 Tax=Treponema saccharophilum DSM 2985 TaxID=907348 RepID=H7ELI1_9SPIR|nr:DNA repair protein RecN [Treponema saccharophilum]EIC01522.1 DNA replication and repair protein RecN [Treponema saccharophilum DSM 2985]BDC95572.1 DNA repair protein RecN [Treponema saccharophilum]
MLEDLSIKDFALIDNAVIELGDGFTVLSGETGAGKSLLIGALTFLLGGKSGADLVRPGASEATVSGTFTVDCGNVRNGFDADSPECEPSSACEWLLAHGITPEDGRVLVRRFVRANGKSGCFVGDTAVTRAELSAFSSFLVDIHGQHEHQNLMKVSEHRKYLDAYAGISGRVAEFTAVYQQLAEKKRRLEQLVADSRDREQRIELLSFAVNEISSANISRGEDEELLEEETRLSSFEKLYSDVSAVEAILGGSDDSDGVVSSLKKARAFASHSASFDKALGALSQRIDSVFYELGDIADEVSSYLRGLVFDPSRLEQVQERQQLLSSLKRKYASSPSAPLDEVLSYLEEARAKLDDLDGNSASQDSLRGEISELEGRVYSEAKALSSLRKEAAARMSAAVVSVLSKLGMASARFKVDVRDKAETETMQRVGAYGMDDVEFMICANPGQPMQPLSKIASGGELSRVMLSLKTILAGSDSVGTMVFDEIDTGIGGEVALSIGEHLRKLAAGRQVLCITHLASIAVYADNQIKISKGVADGMTKTSAVPIDGETRVSEIARMLSGDSDSSASLEHARAMLSRFRDGTVA